jgi:hypothetical protein
MNHFLSAENYLCHQSHPLDNPQPIELRYTGQGRVSFPTLQSKATNRIQISRATPADIFSHRIVSGLFLLQPPKRQAHATLVPII